MSRLPCQDPADRYLVVTAAHPTSCVYVQRTIEWTDVPNRAVCLMWSFFEQSELDGTTYILHDGSMTGKQMVKLLRDNCFVLERINGSHHIEVSVPVHAGKDLKPGTQHRILRETGLK